MSSTENTNGTSHRRGNLYNSKVTVVLGKLNSWHFHSTKAIFRHRPYSICFRILYSHAIRALCSLTASVIYSTQQPSMCLHVNVLGIFILYTYLKIRSAHHMTGYIKNANCFFLFYYCCRCSSCVREQRRRHSLENRSIKIANYFIFFVFFGFVFFYSIRRCTMGRRRKRKSGRYAGYARWCRLPMSSKIIFTFIHFIVIYVCIHANKANTLN